MKSLMKTVFLSLVLIVLPGFVLGQTQPGDAQPNGPQDEVSSKKRWEANLPGGQYAVQLNRISSISKHQYLLDGGLIVTEVVVDTLGSALARFYYLTPVTGDNLGVTDRLADQGQKMLDRAEQVTGLQVADMAQKNYPLTTHARTVEFRLLSIEALNALYDSLYRSWDSGNGRVFTIK